MAPDGKPTRQAVLRAAERGDLEIIEKHLALGEDWEKCLDTRHAYKDYTPLHWAAWRGHREIVELLLNRAVSGSSIFIQDFKGRTAFHFVCEKGYMDMAKMFIETNILVLDVEDYFGRSPLHIAFESGKVNLALHILRLTATDLDRSSSIQATASFVREAQIYYKYFSKCNVHLMKVEDFKKFKRLPLYEECEKKLVSLSTALHTTEDIRILFVSHKVHSHKKPDPMNLQYTTINTFLDKALDGPFDFIWLRHSCMTYSPLDSEYFKSMMPNMLTAAYAAKACLVVPSLRKHGGNEEDLRDFLRRASCRADVIANAFTGSNIWVYDPDSFRTDSVFFRKVYGQSIERPGFSIYQGRKTISELQGCDFLGMAGDYLMLHIIVAAVEMGKSHSQGEFYGRVGQGICVVNLEKWRGLTYVWHGNFWGCYIDLLAKLHHIGLSSKDFKEPFLRRVEERMGSSRLGSDMIHFESQLLLFLCCYLLRTLEIRRDDSAKPESFFSTITRRIQDHTMETMKCICIGKSNPQKQQQQKKKKKKRESQGINGISN